MLLDELRYSIRRLFKAPAFSLAAILTLALGIGATTAVFTVVDSVILKPLTYRDSGQLVVIWEKVKFLASQSIPYTGANPRHETIWKERSTEFSELCLLGVGTRGVSRGVDHPQLVGSIRAQSNFLNLLKVNPLLGRNFVPGDTIQGHDQIAILAYPLWQSLFHRDPNVIGQNIRIAGVPYQVIGVLPENFVFPKRNVLNSFPSKQSVAAAPPVEIVTPLVIDPASSYGWNSDYGNLIALGRLKPGVSVQQAESQLNVIQRQIVNEMPASERDGSSNALLAYVQPLRDAMVGDSRRGLWMLLAAVISLMLIACVDLANAQLGRAVTREREAAVRSALGATASQLLWNSLSESLVLSIVGGAAGILLAFNGLALFQHYAPVDLPRMSEIQPNPAVLVFAIVAIAGSALLFGIMPAIDLVRTDPQKALQQNTSRTQGSRHGTRLRLTLIGLQVFGCTALLLITGFFVKSLHTLLGSDRGFESGNVVAAEVALRSNAYAKDEDRMAFDQAVLQRLQTLPGVTSAALVSAMPLEGESWIEGIVRPDKHAEHTPLWNVRWVSPQYFDVMRERLVKGRFFDALDLNANTAIISEGSAKAGWPGENPIGHQFKWRDKLFTVVGVVADSRINSLKVAPVNMAYLPYRSLPPYTTFFLVRSSQRGSQNSEALLADVRRAIWDRDPEVTISRIKTLDSQVNDSLSAERFQTFVLVAFGVAALLLAMLGVYAVLSYTVAGRTQEIGVRMALGASRQSIYSLTMSSAAGPIIVGLVSGWAASVATGKLVQKLLYGVTPMDWTVSATVALVLLSCAGLAAFLPARRAAASDPMQALRTE